MAGKKELLLIEIREDGARVVKRKISDIGTAGDKTTDIMGKLKTVLAGLVSAKVLRDTVMLADAYANMLNRLRVVTDSTWELERAMEGVFQMSRETRTSMEANIDMFARIAINTKQMGLQYKEMIRFAKQLNHAIILSGVTAREAQWGMVQFSQALASNALRGDELRAILEQLPVVTDVISAHFKVTRGELRELGFQGLITADKIIKAFEEAEESLATRFGKRIPTIDQGMTVLRSAILKFVGDMDQAIQGTSTLARGLLWLADNMEIFGRAALIVATILGAILLKNLILIVAQMKLFSLSILTINPLVTGIIVAGAALAVYSDKIKIASDSTATLADVLSALGEKARLAYKVMRDGIAEIVTETKQVQVDLPSIWQLMLSDVVWLVDGVIRLFQGTGEVIRWFFEDIPNHGKIAWNGLIDGLETVIDYFSAVFATLGDMFRIMSINIKVGTSLLAGSIEQLFAGNFAKAAEYGDQAALSFSNAAKQGMSDFSSLLDKNLKLAASEDSLAGAKFEIEKTGVTVGEVFKFGFNKATVGFFEGLIVRAKEIAAVQPKGGPTEAELSTLPRTPLESKLLKELTGNLKGLKAETEALSSLMYKQFYVAIIRVEKAFSDGTITMSERKDQLSLLKTEMLSYVDSVNVLQTLLDRGRITNEDYAASIDAVRIRQAALKAEFDNVIVSVDAYNRKLTELKLKSLETSTDVISGFKRGFLELGLEMSNFADIAEKTITNAFGGMEDALVSLVTTGKIDFKSMVDSMLADLTRLITRMLFMKALEGMAGGGGGGFGAQFAALFGVKAPSVASSAAPKALGGQTSPGMQYMVGERRPELFTPARPGHITANPAAIQQPPAQEAPITIINVSSEEEAIAAMQSAEGQRVIRNEIRTYQSGSR